MIEKIKALAAALGQALEDIFEWMTERWQRVAAYFGVSLIINIIGLILDFNWLWLLLTVAVAVVGVWLTRVAWLNEQDMKARVEEALAEVDFSDTSRWIGPDDEGYPKRPER